MTTLALMSFILIPSFSCFLLPASPLFHSCDPQPFFSTHVPHIKHLFLLHIPPQDATPPAPAPAPSSKTSKAANTSKAKAAKTSKAKAANAANTSKVGMTHFFSSIETLTFLFHLCSIFFF